MTEHSRVLCKIKSLKGRQPIYATFGGSFRQCCTSSVSSDGRFARAVFVRSKTIYCVFAARIRTRIVGVEGKHADHLTTTTTATRSQHILLEYNGGKQI